MQNPPVQRSRHGLLPSVTDAIGNTPLVELRHVGARTQGRIVAKLENLNPGASKKDRAARQIILDAEQDGTLKAGQTVVELTSGNMGTGLAIVCRARGYPFVAVMSAGNSPERAMMMRALGAEVVLVDQMAGSSPGCVSGLDLEQVERVAQRLTVERAAFRADQFERAGNRRANLQTGEEIWEQTNGCVDAFVDFVGSGGSYAGVIQALKARNPLVRGYVVEPSGAAVLAGRAADAPGHPIQGGGYARTALTHLDGVPIDGFIQVTGDEAREHARLLAREEGIFGGFSAGANLAAAIRALALLPAGSTVAMTVCDSGLKYLSTDLW
jgi:cysteine synthase A